MSEKLRGLLGLAVRAGKITLGANLALSAIKSNHAALVLIDENASENTQKKIRDACAFRNVPLYSVSAGLIDDACGKSDRFAAALSQSGLTDQIHHILDSRDNPIHIDQK